MTSTVKVYEIAEDLKMDTETVLQKIRALGIDVKNKMSKIDVNYVDQIKSLLAKDRQASFIEVEVAPGVKRRVRVEPPPQPAPVPVVRPVARVHTTDVASRTVTTGGSRSTAEARPAAERRMEPESRGGFDDPSAEKHPEDTTFGDSEGGVETSEGRRGVEASVRVETDAVVGVAEPHHHTTGGVSQGDAPEETGWTEPAATPKESPGIAAHPALVPPTAAVTPEASGGNGTDRNAQEGMDPQAVEPVETGAHGQDPRAEEGTTQEPTGLESVEDAPSEESVVGARAGGGATSASPSSPPPAPGTGPRSVPPPGPRTGIAVWNPQTRMVEYHESPGGRNSSAPTNRPARPGAPSTAPTAAKSSLPSRVAVEVPKTPARMPGRMVGGRPVPGGVRQQVGGAGVRPQLAMRSVARPVVASPEMAKHKRVIKIEEQVTLPELARRMSLKATDVLMKLLQLGGAGKNINSSLDSDTAKLLASEFGYEVEDVALDVDAVIKAALPTYEEKPGDVLPRPPVVTVMGHVDHGKTTLLDAILGMRVAEGEAGGITQEVRAYRVSTAKGPVVFFDTPGHEAFTALRMRGAQATDVAVLVVAADDGVMPTTVEAINHAKAANVPLVIALNKMDRPDADPSRVLQQLMAYDIITEENGGETLAVRVSAKARTGIEQLLESLALQTELLDLKANFKKPGVGTVFEAKLDKGRGAIARVLVQEGIVRNGDVVLAGSAYGRIRAMMDDRGRPIEKAGPTVPVEIQGLNKVPTAGDKLYVVADMRKAQEIAEQIAKARVVVPDAPARATVTDLLKAQSGDRQININVVIKADAQGAVEGLRKALTDLSTDKVKVTVIHSAVGAITETDVQLASASAAVILGFNVRPAGKAGSVAEESKVEIRYYNVIYEAVDDIRTLMTGQLKPTLVEKSMGKAEVRQVFNITKVGTIAGCMVTDGMIRRTARARLVRDGVVKWEGKLASLRRFKEDAKEVALNFECGIGLENFADIKPSDVIEAYDVEEVAAQL